MRDGSKLTRRIATIAGVVLSSCSGTSTSEQDIGVNAGGSSAGATGDVDASNGASGVGAAGVSGSLAGTGGTASGGAGASGGTAGRVDYGECTYDCTTKPVPETTLECLCADGSCPESYGVALERVSSCSEITRVYVCAPSGLRAVLTSGGYESTTWFYGAAGELVGAMESTDCNCGPCDAFEWGAGEFAEPCEAVEQCTPCANEVNEGVPACP